MRTILVICVRSLLVAISVYFDVSVLGSAWTETPTDARGATVAHNPGLAAAPHAPERYARIGRSRAQAITRRFSSQVRRAPAGPIDLSTPAAAERSPINPSPKRFGRRDMHFPSIRSCSMASGDRAYAERAHRVRVPRNISEFR